MSSVTGRIKRIKQPRGGYISPSMFDVITFDDGEALNCDENIHGLIVGMVVDYLTRLSMGTNRIEAFAISLQGAAFAEKCGFENAKEVAINLISKIRGIDEESIVNACKLVSFDVWRRSPINAISAKKYCDINPDKNTIHNIEIMVNRCIAFIKKYGPVVKDGFTFEPVNEDINKYKEMILTDKGTYGGYTATVGKGDGDILTKDTIWDLKVLKKKPNSNNTLQLLMYWIMGKHSEQPCFKEVTKVGMFNPRYNTAYLLEISKISVEIIEIVERDVICY